MSGFTTRDAARFHSNIKRTATCWLWTGYRNSGNGYGQMGVTGAGSSPKLRLHYAHRIAWALSHGPIPDGQHVLHSCDVPLCVNPAHLFLGTHRQNMEDAARKGRLSTPRPSRRKLTEEQRDAVRTRYASGGITLQALADEYGVTRTHIWQLVHRMSVEFRARRSA